MSNTDNIYNILNNFNKIAKDAPAPVAATPKAKTKLQESMEQVVNEKYMGFKKTVAAIKKGGSAEDPEAVAAAIGRKKYGKEKFQKAAAAGKKLGEGQDATTYTVAYKDPKKPGKSHSTQVKATSAAEAKAAFQEWDTTNRFTYLGSRPDVDKVYEDHGPENPDAPVNYGEYDREGDMAKDDLYTIDSAAEELYSILQADENLPEWVQSKITKAVDYIDTARDYMKAQSYGQGLAEDQLDEIGNTPAGEAALRAVQNRATDTMDTWSKNSASGYSSTPKQVKKATGAAVSAGNRLHGFGPDRMKQNTVMARDALRKDMAEGADFSAADKVEELVRYYKLFDKRGWTDLFAKLAGRKLQGVPEISREMEYASKFLDLLDSIRMRSEYRGQQDPKKDQELVDLSNQWLDLLNQAEDEFKTMSGQGMAEGSSENKYSNLSNRGVNRGINRAGDDFNRMMDLDQVESPHYKTQHQQDTKQRLKTKPMAGPKGQLPEQGVAEGFGDPEITPGMKTQYGTVVKVNGNTVTVKASNGELTTMNIHDIQQAMAEGFDDMIKDVNRKAKEKGTGKFDKKEISTGTVYTRKYNPKSGETDDTENVSTEKRGRGRPKKSAFEDMSTIDKMIAESFGELFEGTSRPVGDPVSKAAPTAPGVGSGIRVTPMPALATTPKPAIGMGTIKGGVFTATPPKPGEQGVAIPQGLDEVDAEDSGSEPWTGQGLSGSAYKDDRNPLVVRSKLPMGANMTGSTAGPQPYRVKISGYNKPGEQGEPLAPEMDSMNSMDPGTPQPQPTAFNPAPVARPDLDEADAEMEGMRKLAGLKGDQPKLDRDQDGELTRKDFEMLRKGLEEGGRDDYDDHIDKVEWLMGKPNYLSRGEAKETAYYTKDTDPVWDGYRDDADEVGENLEVRANPAGASSAEQAKKIGAQFPQQNGKEPNLAYKIGEDEFEENLIVVPNLSGAGSVAAAKKLGAMMPAKPGEKDPISTNEEDMEEGGAFGLAVTNAKRDGIQPGETFKVGGKEYDLKEGDAALNQMRRIAGLKECDMSPISGMASDMEKQQGSMNISTNQSSDGTKSVTITAAGDAASDLMQMLKLAGMGGGAAPAAAAEPEIVVVAQDGEETMEEEKDPRYQASTTPDEQVAPVQALTKGGNGDVAGQEKTMKPGGYQFGDNNLAMQESLSTQLMKEYNSIKVKK